MKRTGYEVLGFAVWTGAKWYLRRRIRGAVGGRRKVALGLLGAAVAGVVAVQAGRSRS